MLSNNTWKGMRRIHKIICKHLILCYTIYAASAFGHVLAWGSGVSFDECAPLPSFFEAFVYRINPFANDLRFRNIENFSWFIQLLYSFFIKPYAKHSCFRIVCWTPHLFLIADNLTSFCSDNNNISYVATYVKPFQPINDNKEEDNLFWLSSSLLSYVIDWSR